MADFIRTFWAFLWNRKDHPIVAHELGGWSYMRLWRGLRRGCLPIMIVVLLLSGGGCGLLTTFALLDSTSTPGDWVLVPLTVLIGVLVAGELIRWLASLLLTAMTSTALSAEVEAQTLALLRVSPLPTREIVLAKFGAAMQQFRLPILVSMVARVLFLLGLATLGIIGLASLPAGTFAAPQPSDLLSLPVLPPGMQFTLMVGLGLLAITLLAWLAYYVLGPAISLIFFGAVGIFASSLARTRATGLMSAVGVRIGVWMASYIGGQLVSTMLSLLAFPFMFAMSGPGGIPSNPNPANPVNPFLVVSGSLVAALAWVLLLAGVQLGGALLLLRAATSRLDRTV